MAAMTKSFVNFPFEGETYAVLTSQGLTSIYDILAVERSVFCQMYDEALDGNALAIYQHAAHYRGHADQMLREEEKGATYVQGGEYLPPMYARLFPDKQTRFASPGSLESLDSPVSYMMYLLMLLQRKKHPGSTGTDTALSALWKLRPDLHALLISHRTFEQALPGSELAGEILQSALMALIKQEKTSDSDIDIDHWLAFADAPSALPFDVARTRMDLLFEQAGCSLGEAWSTVSPDYRQYADKTSAALIWNGLNIGQQEQILQPPFGGSDDQAQEPLCLIFDEHGQALPLSGNRLRFDVLWPGCEIEVKEPSGTVDMYPLTGKGIDKDVPKWPVSLTAKPAEKFPDTLLLTVMPPPLTEEQLKTASLYCGEYTCTVTVKDKDKDKDKTLPSYPLSLRIIVGKGAGNLANTRGLFAEQKKDLQRLLGDEISELIAPQMQVPVDIVCQCLGISCEQLQAACAVDHFEPVLAPNIHQDKSGTTGFYGARYLWRQPVYLEERVPGTIQDGMLNITPAQLYRLQKLVRLQKATQLSYGELNHLMRSAEDMKTGGSSLEKNALLMMGVFKRYQQAYHLTAEQVAALFFPLSHCAPTGEKSLLEQLLTVEGKPVFPQKFSLLPGAKVPEFGEQDKQDLAAALGINIATMMKLLPPYNKENSEEENNKKTVALSLQGVTALYRPILLARSFSISVETLLRMLAQINQQQQQQQQPLALLERPVITDTVTLLLTLDEMVSWAKAKKYDLNALMTLMPVDVMHQQTLIDMAKNSAAQHDDLLQQIKEIATALKKDIGNVEDKANADKANADKANADKANKVLKIANDLTVAADAALTTAADPKTKGFSCIMAGARAIKTAATTAVNMLKEEKNKAVNAVDALTLKEEKNKAVNAVDAVTLKEEKNKAVNAVDALTLKEEKEKAIKAMDAVSKTLDVATRAMDAATKVTDEVARSEKQQEDLLSQQLHLEPRAAQVLRSYYATLLNSPPSDTSDFSPLWMAAWILNQAHLPSDALEQMTGSCPPSDTLWQQCLFWSDWVDLARGEKPVRPALLAKCMPADAIRRMAEGYRTESAVIKRIMKYSDPVVQSQTIGEGYDIRNHHQLHRMAKLSTATGWPVASLTSLTALEQNLASLTEQEEKKKAWELWLSFSVQGKPDKESNSIKLARLLEERRNVALLLAYKFLSRHQLIQHRHLHGESAWTEHEPTTVDVADRLLIDPAVTANVTTSRIAEAIVSIQTYIQRIVDGRDPHQWPISEQETQNWNDTDRHYALWAASQQLRWHPDQYINPVARQKKSSAFKAFESQLAQAHLDPDSIDDALSTYLSEFDEVVNLSTIGAYQDGLCASQSTLYCLGASPYAPFTYYYRTWGKDRSGLQLWSSWKKIALPMAQQVWQSPSGGRWINQDNIKASWRGWKSTQARLVMFGGRLCFIWVETRTAAPPEKQSDKNTESIPKYQHVISLVYQKINGSWSTPVEIYQGEAKGKVDMSPHLMASVCPKGALAHLGNMITDQEAPTEKDSIHSDILIVVLTTIGESKEGQSEPDNQQYCLLDEDFVTIRFTEKGQKEVQNEAIQTGNSVSLSGSFSKKQLCAVNEQTNPLLATLTDLGSDSWLKNSNTSDADGTVSSTYVLYPCIPHHWLYNQRRQECRSERLFGHQLSMALTVSSEKEPGNSGLDSFIVQSEASFSDGIDKIQALVPENKKLIHFISVYGRTRCQPLRKNIPLKIAIPYDNDYLSEGEARHGIIMVDRFSSDIPDVYTTEDAWIESGYLTVLHKSATELATEIRTNKRGVQYLYAHDTDAQQGAAYHESALHARPIDGDLSEMKAVEGFYCQLLLLDKATTPDKLTLQDLDAPGKEWEPLSVMREHSDSFRALWTYEIPLQGQTPWLVLRVEGSAALTLQKITLPSDASAYKIDGDKLVRVALSGDIKAPSSDIYLFYRVTPPTTAATQESITLPVSESGPSCPVAFKFYPPPEVSAQENNVTLTMGALCVVSQAELENALQKSGSGPNNGNTLFNAQEWGWIQPTFTRTDSDIYRMNRTYRLGSGECHYFLMRVDTAALVEGKALGLLVQSLLTLPNSADLPACYMVGEKNGTITLLNGSMFRTETSMTGRSISLTLENTAEICSTYSQLFLAIPWALDAMSEVARDGLCFQVTGLKVNKTETTPTSFKGFIPCEIPALSDVVIRSRCSPGTVKVGDTVTVNVDIIPGTTTVASQQAVKVNLDLHPAYQLLGGAMRSGGIISTPEGNVSLSLAAGCKIASFTLPVRVLNHARDDLPLATLTMSSGDSSRRVALARPAIEHPEDAAPRIEWDWYYGARAASLTSTPAKLPLPAFLLDSPYLFAVLKITAIRSARPVTVTLTLPQGIEFDNGDSFKELIKAIVQNPDHPDKAAWLAGMKAFLTASPSFSNKVEKDNNTTKLTLGNIMLSETSVFLPVQLKKSAAADKFTGNLSARVSDGQGHVIWESGDVTTSQIGGGSALSAGLTLNPRNGLLLDEETPADKDGGANIESHFGDNFIATLVIKVSVDTELDAVDLHMANSLEFSGDEKSVRMIPWNTANSSPPPPLTVQTGGQKLTLSGLPALAAGSYQIDVPLRAAKPVSNADNGLKFEGKGKDGNNSWTSNVVHITQTRLTAGHASVTAVRNMNNSEVIPDNTLLPVGSAFFYRVDFSLSAEERTRQLVTGQKITLDFSVPGTMEIINIQRNGKTLEISPEEGKRRVTQEITPSPTGVKEQWYVGVKVTLPKNAGDGKASCIASIAGSTLNQSEYLSVAIDTFDGHTLPFNNVQFTVPGRRGFSRPQPLATRPLLTPHQTQVMPHRIQCVRLNTHFGMELVHTARHHPQAIFRAAAQDHLQPPMLGEVPQPLEQDIANQIYFWELFYHVPALIAYRLNQDGRYDEAQSWLHYLFTPQLSREDTSLSPWHCRLLTTSFSYVSLDQASGPVDPDVIASVKPEFYRRATFFAYVKNLLDNGDRYYRSQTRDGLNMARQYYFRVAHLLGEGETVNTTLAWQPTTVGKAVETLSQSSQWYDMFALPRSYLYQTMLEQLQQRLFNLRHGLTLNGVPLALPLYDSPADPNQLMAAYAQDGMTAASGAEVLRDMPLPMFRYGTLYARTSAVVEALMQYGNTLLSYLNMQQDQKYQQLLITQQKEMSDFVIGQQQLSMQMNQQAREGLITARDAAKEKLTFLEGVIAKPISSREQTAMDVRLAASATMAASSGMRTVGAALDALPNIFGMANGGMHYGSIPVAIAEVGQAGATILECVAYQTETREIYERRKQEWEQQKEETQASLKQLNTQLEVDTRQQELLARQLAQSQAQARQFEQQLRFLAARFTNTLLYQWLTTQLSALYYQVYDVANGLCQQTLAAWRYEVGDYDPSHAQFFRHGGWNDAIRGLLAGEQLRLGLLQMDQAYLAQAERRLEIRHTVSLKALQLTQARGDKAVADKAWTACHSVTEDGAVNFTVRVTEAMLAQRYPGHYLRQVVDVSVTLPCLVGPYEEMCATLTQTRGGFAINEDEALEMIKQPTYTPRGRPNQFIAISSGLDDNGILLNFGDDKYLPFEGCGVVGEWVLTIPNADEELQKRMLSSLNDVILTFRYRAKVGTNAGKIRTELAKLAK